MAMGLCLVPAGFIQFVVREQENKSKHQQLVSGVSPVAYWVATYIWDFLSYQLVVLCYVLALIMFGVDVITNASVFPAVILMLELYALAMAPFSYVLSFFIASASSSQVRF